MQIKNINLQYVMPQVNLKAGLMMICWLVILIKTKLITHFGNCRKTKFTLNVLMLILLGSVANVMTRVLLMLVPTITITLSMIIVLMIPHIFWTSVLRILLIGCLAQMM